LYEDTVGGWASLGQHGGISGQLSGTKPAAHSTAAYDGKGGGKAPGPYGTPGPDLRDLPPHWDGSSASAMAWMNWFFNAIQSGELVVMYSMPPQIAIDGFGWPPEIVAQIQAAWEGLTTMLRAAGQNLDVNGLMWIINQWQTGTPPINP